MDANLLGFIAGFEGFRSRMYLDSVGVPTVGYGFNLDRRDAVAKLRGVGLDHDGVMAGRQSITQDQAKRLLLDDARAAEETAMGLFPLMADYPPAVRMILVDMVYNLGASRFTGFKGFIRAIKGREWALAGLELVFRNLGSGELSGYWQQTVSRARHHATTLGILSKQALVEL